MTAAHEWDTPGIKMSVNPSRSDSVEHLLHRAFPDQNALLLFSAKTINEAVNRLLGEARLERFIGVVYKVGIICLLGAFRAHSCI